MSESMSDERLAAIRQHAEERPFLTFEEPLDRDERVRVRLAFQERWQLLAEVERLRAEVAALRPIVEAMATYTSAPVSVFGYDTYSDCPFCGEENESDEEHPGSPAHVLITSNRDKHLADCPITKARALVNGEA